MAGKAIFTGLIITGILVVGLYATNTGPGLIPGIVCGAFLMGADLAAITFLVKRILNGRNPKFKPFYLLIFLGKLLFIGAILFLLIAKWHVNGLGIILGLTVMLFSVISFGLVFGLHQLKELKETSDGRNN